jgi:hypothetical protein
MKDYPENATDVIKERKYKPDVIRAMYALKRQKFYAADNNRKKELICELHEKLCAIYGKTTTLAFKLKEDAPIEVCQGMDFLDVFVGSRYDKVAGKITVVGKPSLITYLHEFAHSVFGDSEKKACEWSLNLYKRVYPKDFAKLTPVGHVMVKKPAAQAGASP